MKFEEAIKELEETVKKLEDVDTTLDEAMELFEKGVQITNECNKLLGEAQMKVTKLVGDTQKHETDFTAEQE